jgi:hypothetical protein
MNANGEGNPHAAPRPTTPADFEMGGSEAESRKESEPFVEPSPPSPASDDQPPDPEPFYSRDIPPPFR